MSFSRALVRLLIALPAFAAQAQQTANNGWESQERIRATAARYVAAQSPATAKVEAAALDSRLRLPACAQALVASSSANAASRSSWNVAVACESAPGGTPLWSVYVPVRVADLRPVAILTRPLPPNQPIPADAVAMEPRDISTLAYGYVSDPAQVIGQTLRRPLSPGAAITPDALAAVKLIKRGALVTVLGRIGTLEVRSEGKALADGGNGERISVENLSSHRVVEGVIRSNGVVEVAL